MNKRRIAFESASELVVARAYSYSRKMYGVHGKLPLDYHNHLHVIDVINAATALGGLALQRGLIKPKDVVILQIAAAGHDLIQSEDKSGQNELLSAKKIASWLAKETRPVFKKSFIDRVEAIIPATTVKKTKDGSFKQSAGNDILEQLLCDADVSAAGMPPKESAVRSERIYKERLGENPNTPERRLDFLHKQLKFYETHKWYTAEAEQLFPHQADNIIRTKHEIADLMAA